jgi:hypothetical protein
VDEIGPQHVDNGEAVRDSLAALGFFAVKLLAKNPGDNKPRVGAAYSLQQLIDSNNNR